MKATLTNDSRGAGLLDRVRQDISHLREDIGNLLSHTTRETLPNSARDLADQAKNQIAASSAYAASRLQRLRQLRRQVPVQQNHHTASWVGGALIAGAVAYGVYALCRSCCCNGSECDGMED